MLISTPVKKNSYQYCTNIEASAPYQLVKWENENQAIRFLINDFPPFATKVITLQANIAYYSIPQKRNILNKEIYLLPEPYIESNHPDIALLAKRLTAESPLETARNIYKWVSSQIAYAGYIKNPRGALYALTHKKGDCTEFMSLFVALCRANNIPSRGIGGYSCSGQNCILKPSNYHNWAEFYVNGSWLISDCQKKVFARENMNYIAMKNISEDQNNPMKGYSRFRVQGSGLKVKMN